MKQYSLKDIRNVAIVGHGGVGKTSVAEGMLFLSGVNDRLGKTGDTSHRIKKAFPLQRKFFQHHHAQRPQHFLYLGDYTVSSQAPPKKGLRAYK
jgi:hypothetical protein